MQDLVRVPMENGELSTPENEFSIYFAHVAPNQCSMRLDLERSRAWVIFQEEQIEADCCCRNTGGDPAPTGYRFCNRAAQRAKQGTFGTVFSENISGYESVVRPYL